MSIFRLTMHPASDGDALLLSWGEDNAPHHALIDLGRSGDYRHLKPLLQQAGQFELFTITHIDIDHIGGVVSLFKETKLPFTPKHIWFNAYDQLVAARNRLPPRSVTLGTNQGEQVSQGIGNNNWPLNKQFASTVVSVDSPEGSQPIPFPGGLTLRLLSPSDTKLAQLLPAWDNELQKARMRLGDADAPPPARAGGHVAMGGINVDSLVSQPFSKDTSAPNGSSIAFLAEFEGKRILLGADAHADVIEASLSALGASKDSPYPIACLKVPHHGSKANTSPALLDLIDCSCFAFSTNGTQHDHPDPETIARILKKYQERDKRLFFNFRQPHTAVWDAPALKHQWKYDCVFPTNNTQGVTIDI